mmetsp:Transcript_23055/g.67996  ORF Transcript_23055/g.67996 Transcript_23055/m.67996 type:complete len:93 (-) Transcript_23055:22-300(-)
MPPRRANEEADFLPAVAANGTTPFLLGSCIESDRRLREEGWWGAKRTLRSAASTFPPVRVVLPIMLEQSFHRGVNVYHIRLSISLIYIFRPG